MAPSILSAAISARINCSHASTAWIVATVIRLVCAAIRGFLLNYEQFKRLIADHTDFPDTYDEWLGPANEQVTHMIKQGYVVTKVTIDPAEFTQYCHRTGSDYDPSLLTTSQISREHAEPVCSGHMALGLDV